MSVELNATPRLRCNLRCTYCYQAGVRARLAGEADPAWDIEAVKRAVERGMGRATLEEVKEQRRERPVLFGGEPLLAPRDQLRAWWAWCLERWGGSALQTNGALLTDAVVEDLVRYRVSVSVSWDGPEELSFGRWAGTPEATLVQEGRTRDGVLRCVLAGITPSVSFVLNRYNAGPARLPRLLRWLGELDDLGVRAATFHLLERDGDARHVRLTEDETVEAVKSLYRLELGLRRLRFRTFTEALTLLRARDGRRPVGCVWTGCDPDTTTAVHGVEVDGTRSKCARVLKDGRPVPPAPRPSYARQLRLWSTPQEEGGCAGCRFFVVCKGYCPGTGEGGDVWARTEHCGVWKRVLAWLEGAMVKEGEAPVTTLPELPEVEGQMVRSWYAGRRVSVEAALAAARGDPVGAALAEARGEPLGRG